MIRRSSGWGSQPGGVLYPRRGGGNWARPLILGMILIAFVAVGAFLFLNMFGGDDCSGEYCASNAEIATPEGYERLSEIYEWKGSPDAAAAADLQVSVPLTDATEDARNVYFFRYDEASQAWEPFVGAILAASNDAVTGRFNTAPPVIAVMRRLSGAGHVIVYVNHNTPLHPDAAALATIVHTRDYTVASDGTLIGEPTDRTTLGLPANSAAQVLPVISADASEPQAKAVISSLLSSSQTRTAHVQAIVQAVLAANLPGVDINYTNLPVTDRTGFALFVSELATSLHGQQKLLTVTLPAPVVLPDRIDEGAYNWAEIGRAADIVQIGVYRDQNTYRINMPGILSDLVTKVPASKLVLTVSPYATEKGPENTLQSMPLLNALKIAAALQVNATSSGVVTNSNVEVVANNIDRTQNRSGITWDSQVASVAFTYDFNGGRTVWIENVFSVGFKLEFIPRFGLSGVAVEEAAADDTLGNIWPAIVPFVSSGQPILLRPNPEDLLPRWSVGDGSAEGGDRGVLSWLTPSTPGTYAITLIISDGVVVLENVIEVNVNAAESPTPASGG